MKSYKLSNGVVIPAIGYGTADLTGNIEEHVISAVRSGYRLFDTASVYNSESEIGTALKKLSESGEINRKDIFISSKLDVSMHGYNETMQSFERTLNRLQTEYLDMYLIHWPVPRGLENNYREKNIETWQAFEYLYNNGKIRVIGVCNFLERHLMDIFNNCKTRPMINQLEIHPQFQQRGLARFCREQGMAVEAWSPLGSGRLIENTDLASISQKYNKSIAQICLRWNVQKGNIPLPRSSNSERMKQNIDIFDFLIEQEDIDLLDSFNTADRHLDIWSYKRQQMY